MDIKMDIKIVDTTLRDGEQTPGIAFNTEEKLKIAIFLDKLGVDYIEVGTPALGVEEQQAVEKILNQDLRATIITWNRALISDIQKSIECGSRYLHISLPVSDIHINTKLKKDKPWILETLKRAADYVRTEGLQFSVGAEDASRADPGFLYKFVQIAEESGAHHFRYCDTVGILDPFTLYQAIKDLMDSTNIDIEIHTHNDFGLATANALAGVRSGAKLIDTTFIGIGERAGNAALEEVVMALKYTMGIKLKIDTSLFREFSQFMVRAIGRELHPWKSIIGSYVFAHESGIHVDGVLKDPGTYEPFPPEEVGNARRLLIGKHSGRHAIIDRFRELGIKIDDGESIIILRKVKKSAVSMKGSVPDSELMRIYENTVIKR
ncbi:MAG: homocitrate synthase [Nitrospinota bacterium]